MLLFFYVIKIHDCLDDFTFSYEQLRKTSSLNEDELDKNQIWESINLLCTSAGQLANIFSPQLRSDRREKNLEKRKRKKLLTQHRGKTLQQLFEIDFEEQTFSVLKDLRNRLVHFDEDVDNWYFDSDKPGERQIIWKSFEDVEHHKNQCVMQHYDYQNRIIRNFGVDYPIHELKDRVKIISQKLNRVDKMIAQIKKNRTNVEIL